MFGKRGEVCDYIDYITTHKDATVTLNSMPFQRHHTLWSQDLGEWVSY